MSEENIVYLMRDMDYERANYQIHATAIEELGCVLSGTDTFEDLIRIFSSNFLEGRIKMPCVISTKIPDGLHEKFGPNHAFHELSDQEKKKLNDLFSISIIS